MKQAHFCSLPRSILGSGWLRGLRCRPVKRSVAWPAVGPGLAESTPGLGRFFHCSVTSMTQLGEFWVLCFINCLLISRTSRISPIIWRRRFKTLKNKHFSSHPTLCHFEFQGFTFLHLFFPPSHLLFLSPFLLQPFVASVVQMNVLLPCLFFSGNKVQRPL